jgi:hydrogenase maturation protease
MQKAMSDRNGDTEKSDTIQIVGVGNEFRSDDGIGIHVARRLRKLNLSQIEITENVKDGIELMELWKNKEYVIIIDAASTGSEPGMIYRFDATKKPLPTKFANRSSHNFSVAEAIELSRKLSQLPSKLVIYGIEGKDFSHGEKLSDPVQKVSGYVIDLILQETKPSVQQMNHSR